MQTSIRIDGRFRGPPQSGNGGYVTGLMADLLLRERPHRVADAAEVTLRAPVPLDRELSVAGDATGLRVTEGEMLVAEGRRATLAMDVPVPATYEEALAVRATSVALRRGEHPFLEGERVGFHPVCFCCGAELAADAGLHVYAAAVPGRAQVAAAWIAPAAYATAEGTLPPAIVCTALDCPGQFAWLAEGTLTGLLGRMTVRIDNPLRAGERCVVIGWTMGQERRKFHAGTALFNERRELCAYAKAVWIGGGPVAK